MSVFFILLRQFMGDYVGTFLLRTLTSVEIVAATVFVTTLTVLPIFQNFISPRAVEHSTISVL